MKKLLIVLSVVFMCGCGVSPLFQREYREPAPIYQPVKQVPVYQPVTPPKKENDVIKMHIRLIIDRSGNVKVEKEKDK